MRRLRKRVEHGLWHHPASPPPTLGPNARSQWHKQPSCWNELHYCRGGLVVAMTENGRSAYLLALHLLHGLLGAALQVVVHARGEHRHRARRPGKKKIRKEVSRKWFIQRTHHGQRKHRASVNRTKAREPKVGRSGRRSKRAGGTSDSRPPFRPDSYLAVKGTLGGMLCPLPKRCSISRKALTQFSR